ncbi:selenocysteine lyase/cysteine desulfurase [Bradyrhizobium sp. LA2.1]
MLKEGVGERGHQRVTSSAAIATDNAYWGAVRGLYSVTPDIVNLENGYWGIMAEPVRREFIRQLDMVNYQNSYYARERFGRDFESVRGKVAVAVGAAPEEIALTRGATEALQLLIGGYNKLKPGDAVVYTDLDYDSM